MNPNATQDVNEKFRRLARRENARKKDRRTTGHTFTRSANPYTRQPKHRLTTTQED